MKKRRGILRNIYVMILVFLLVATVLMPGIMANMKSDKIRTQNSNVGIFRTKSENQLSLIDLFTGTVHTNCGGIEKSTDIVFAFLNGIDVDNNQSTGVNGNDIEVRYILVPLIVTGENLILGLSFVLSFDLLNDDIKNEDFSVSMEIGRNNIQYGFCSPDEPGNEIPDHIDVAFSMIFYITERLRGFKFDMNPDYDSGMSDKKIILFAEHNGKTEKSFSFEFDPVIEGTSEVKSTLIDGRWEYKFNRDSSYDSKVTTTHVVNDGAEKTTKFTVDHLPQDISFELDVTPFSNGGGKLIYESDRMFDINLSIESSQMGTCKYATLQHTPTKLIAEWKPTIQDGYFNVNIESDGTEFTVQDALDMPDKSFILNNFESVEFQASWNLSNPGELIIQKTTGLNADLDLQMGEWTATADIRFETEYVKLEWDLGISGYLKIDTNGEPLIATNILVMGPGNGFETTGEGLTSEDFEIYWTLWLPIEWSLTTNGYLYFMYLSIDINLDGTWYHIWPPST